LSLEHLQIARLAAREGGKILFKRLGNAGNLDFKGKINLVTDTDRESEEAILEFLSKNSPGVHITSEENEESHRRASERWIVDPLDGTTNFTHSLPGYSVSIAYEKEGVIEAGVVFDPHTDDEFTAAIGSGAKLNDESIKVSEVNKLTLALVVTGFPYDSEGILDLVERDVNERSRLTQAWFSGSRLLLYGYGKIRSVLRIYAPTLGYSRRKFNIAGSGRKNQFTLRRSFRCRIG